MAGLVAAGLWALLEVCVFGANFNDPHLTTSEAFTWSAVWTCVITGICVWVWSWLKDVLYVDYENDTKEGDSLADSE
jgi:hypothetical protein